MSSKNLPILFQTRSYECGLVCMAMIGCYYGKSTALDLLRKKFPSSERGFSVADLIKMGSELGLNCAAFRLNVEAIGSINPPAILHWGNNHFVVLRRLTASEFVVHDPAAGIQTMQRRKFASQFSNVAIVVSENEEEMETLATKSEPNTSSGMTGNWTLVDEALPLTFS